MTYRNRIRRESAALPAPIPLLLSRALTAKMHAATTSTLVARSMYTPRKRLATKDAKLYTLLLSMSLDWSSMKRDSSPYA